VGFFSSAIIQPPSKQANLESLGFGSQHPEQFLILALADFVGGIENIELRLDTRRLASLDHALQSSVQHSSFPLS
jgi:hypothetical protein